MLNFSKSVQKKKQTHLDLGLRVKKMINRLTVPLNNFWKYSCPGVHTQWSWYCCLPRIRLHGLLCYVTWELKDWAVVGFVDTGAEWKACVMLQESVFSISPVIHNIEDNDDEETDEDHKADGLFPRGTENSFYLQYSHVLFFTLYCYREQMRLNVYILILCVYTIKESLIPEPKTAQFYLDFLVGTF